MNKARTRIKFCGITRSEDAARAVDLGVDALGFVLVPASKRQVSLEVAQALARQLPPFINVVALLSNAEPTFVREVIARLRPSLLQFHGSETPDDCNQFDYPYLKAVAMQSPDNFAQALASFPRACGLLLDSHAAGGLGGTGKPFDWNLLPSATRMPLMIAGGLDAANVGKVITMARPYAVDVSSGIELSPGVKDPDKMRAFVEAVRRADAN